MWNTFKCFDQNDDNLITSWDSMKVRLKKFYTIKGIMRSKENRSNLNKKEKEIQTLVNNLNTDELDTSERYRQLKAEILDYEKQKIQQFRLQNRINNIELEMEVPNKTFFQKCLDRKKSVTITALKSKDGKLISDPNGVLDIIHEFYSDLWSKRKDISDKEQDDYLSFVRGKSAIPPDISPVITLNELNDARKAQFKLGVTPGPDGFSNEFYLEHWYILNNEFLNVLNKAYVENELPKSMYEANIKLIPKKGDLTNIKNWRPIALLNMDYMILSRILYEKVVGFLNKQTNQAQKGIFPGRNINSVHFNSQSLINYVKENNLDSAILKIDLEKAFDNVNHSFIFKMLHKLNLPSSIIKWIRILYKNPVCRVLVNGSFTNIIDILNGIRQGCPLSMLLFGIILEALIQKVQNDDAINGMSFGKFTHLKLQACADDVTFYVKDKKSIDAIMEKVRIFGLYSGQRLNEKKLALIAHGSQMQNDIKTSSYADKLKSKLTILGIVYSFNDVNLYENLVKPLKKSEKIIDLNKDRNLSLYGKIQILKTQVLPLFFMKMQCLDIEPFLKQIEKMIYDFLWYPSKAELIEKSKVICNYNHGGLSMVDITSRYKAALVYKLKVIAQATDKSEFWVKMAYYNIGFTLRKVNRSLFSNLEPHKTSGDLYWSKIKLIFNELPADFDWLTIKFKDLYILFKSMVECKNESKLWTNIQYLNKRYKHCFNNHEREISYLVGCEALQFGQFLRRSSVFVDVEDWFTYNCKFCNSYEDNLDHLLIPNCVVIKQVFLMAKHLFKFVARKDIIFDQKLLFHNEISGLSKMKTDSEDFRIALAKLKLSAILKRVIIDEKKQCDRYGTFIGWIKEWTCK